MKKLICICLAFVFAIGALVSCNRSDAEEKPTEELEFHLLDDGTYGVSAGDAKDFEKIVIPATHEDKAVTTIMDKAFYEAKNIKSITVPDSVTRIGAYAFAECSGLKKLTIGNGVVFVGVAAFNNCSNLEYNKYENGYYLGNKANPYVILVFANAALAAETTEFFIHEATRIIHFAAFYKYSNLKRITIPNGVICIGEDAFIYCDSLTSVTIPDSVTSVCNAAFFKCSNLESVKFGSGVTCINEDMFYECANLETVELPAGLKSIENGAFARCSNLKQIKFGGTEAEWDAVSKPAVWGIDENQYTIVCNGQ